MSGTSTATATTRILIFSPLGRLRIKLAEVDPGSACRRCRRRAHSHVRHHGRLVTAMSRSMSLRHIHTQLLLLLGHLKDIRRLALRGSESGCARNVGMLNHAKVHVLLLLRRYLLLLLLQSLYLLCDSELFHHQRCQF